MYLLKVLACNNFLIFLPGNCFNYQLFYFNPLNALFITFLNKFIKKTLGKN